MTTLLNPWNKRKWTARAILSSILMCAQCSKSMASDGLYVGIGIGSSFMYGKIKNSSPIESNKLRKQGHLATAFIGYNHLIKDTPMFVGIEAGFQNHAMKKKVDGTVPGRASPYMLAISTNNSIVGHLKLGFVVSNISFYCKGGVAQTNFKALYQAVGKEKEAAFKKLGASAGLGAEAKLNKNFSIGFEHNYTKYGSLNGIAQDLGYPNARIWVTPEIHVTSLRLIYNF
jgi:opacity protein-like surface antigen